MIFDIHKTANVYNMEVYSYTSGSDLEKDSMNW